MMKITHYNMIIDYQLVSQQSGLYVRIMYQNVLNHLFVIGVRKIIRDPGNMAIPKSIKQEQQLNY